MLKKISVCAVALALFAVTTQADAADIKSGPQVGKSVGAFFVTKKAGAEDDGVALEKNLCYRCRNGRRPQVMVFTRSTDPKVLQLIKSLDAAVADNSDKNLRAFVNLLGDNQDDLADAAKSVAKNSKAKNVPFVIPNEFENGPDNYGINAKAEVTIIMAKGLTVQANHAAASAKDLNVEAVIADVKKLVK